MVYNKNVSLFLRKPSYEKNPFISDGYGCYCFYKLCHHAICQTSTIIILGEVLFINEEGQMRHILSFLMIGLLLASAPTYADESLMLRINGLMCPICIGGVVSGIAKLDGVKEVELWMADGMLAITGSHISTDGIKRVVARSAYTYQGLWSCPKATANLGSCKKVG